VLFYALGMALVRSGAAPDDAAGTEATEAFRTAVRLRPDFPQPQAELGKILLKRGDVQGAIVHLEKAMALEPEEAAPAYVLAQAYRRNGQMDRARDLLARVSTLNARERGDDPDDEMKRMVVRLVREGSTPPRAPAAASAAAAEYERSLACASAGDLEGSIATLRQVIESAPVFADARYALGLNLWNRFKAPLGGRRKEDLDEAVAALRQAVDLEANRPQFHMLLGQLLAEQQNLGPAIEHLKRAATLAPQDPETAYNLGVALRLNGDLEAAEVQFRAAVGLNADHALARRSLGLILRQRGDVAAAADELRRAAAARPDDAQGPYLLGTVLLRLGDVPAAIDALRQATRLDPTLTEAHVTLAQAFAKNGQKDEALMAQAEVQRLNAEKADFGRMLVLLDASADLLKKGKVADAIAQGREALALVPTFAEAHYQLGLALRQDPRAIVEAESAFRQAIALDARHARAHRELGRLLESKGDKDGAQEALQHAAALAPCS
jgi:tetratricopeptide (TPR) repeat protein